MKNLKLFAVSALVMIASITTAQTKKINAEKSSIAWVGKKVTGAHSGTIAFKEGNLIFKKSKLF